LIGKVLIVVAGEGVIGAENVAGLRRVDYLPVLRPFPTSPFFAIGGE
jgi:hypothetical protein